jgi:DNA-binding NarL/FixJ family response regulator
MVVDDEALVRSGVSIILDTTDEIEVVASCGGGEAIDSYLRHRPDVVLLDIRMPDVDGLTVLQRLRDRVQPPIVAMLTTFSADEHVAVALERGASGFLLKDTDPDQLIHSVRALAAGGCVLSPLVTMTVIAGYLGSRDDQVRKSRIDSLSPRERQVLALVGEGLANAEIGKRLFMSVPTVKEHLSAVLTKLGLANRVQAAVLAYRAGLVDRP